MIGRTDRALRVALIAPLVTSIREPQLGGSQALLADLAAGLTRRGHGVDVYAASGSAIAGAHVIDTGVDPGSLAGARYRHGGPQAVVGGVEEAFDHVFALVEGRDYDVVHNHAFDPPALRRSHAGRVRVIHTVHLPPEHAAAAALMEAQMGPEPAILVAVSTSQARQWGRHVEIDRVITGGVPVGRIPWSDEQGAGLIFAGRLSAEKGGREAVEVALMAGEHIDVYGYAYDEEYARTLRGRFAGHEGVRFHPPLPRADLWRQLASARAVLCPVSWDEPFGLLPAEALAAGTPVVGFARGGLTEVVEDGVTGLLVEPGHLDRAAAAVRAVGEIDRRTCRQHAVDHLDLEACIDAYEDLYTAP